MGKIYLNIENNISELFICNSTDEINDYLNNRNIFAVIDSNVAGLYDLDFLADERKIVIGSGEKIKTLESIEAIINKLLELKAGKDILLLGIGGGVVCDLIGFTASVFKRGVKFGLMPTTLIAQSDAAIGGKTAVNIKNFKNQAGTFYLPEFTFIDTLYLGSLDKRELISGFAEIIKTACIADSELFELLENKDPYLILNDNKLLKEILLKTVKAKISIVEKDYREKSIRKILNFGHTFGHSIELAYGLSHGEAVALGMVKAIDISEKLMLLESSKKDKIIKLIKSYGLPVEITTEQISLIMNNIHADKKRKGGYIDFILLEDIGSAVIKEISLNELTGFIS